MEEETEFQTRAVKHETTISNPPTDKEIATLASQLGKTPEEILQIIKEELVKRIGNIFS